MEAEITIAARILLKTERRQIVFLQQGYPGMRFAAGPHDDNWHLVCFLLCHSKNFLGKIAKFKLI